MSRNRSWLYAIAPSSRYGLMICGTCRQPIEVGDYRVRETSEAYITHHRACSEQDPHWAVLDRQRQGSIARRQKLFAAAAEFVAAWGWQGVEAAEDCLRALESAA